MTESDIEAALERYLINETQKTKTPFPIPEELADSVDLEVAGFSPVLMPHLCFPSKVVRLGNGKFAIYDVGYPHANMGNHRWNVDEQFIRIQKARFLIQRDLFFQDLVFDPDNQQAWFRWWNGGYLIAPKWDVRNCLIPQFIQSGTFIPDKNTNPLGQAISANYVYADGSIEVSARLK